MRALDRKNLWKSTVFLHLKNAQWTRLPIIDALLVGHSWKNYWTKEDLCGSPEEILKNFLAGIANELHKNFLG